jgi:hypothetical protein
MSRTSSPSTGCLYGLARVLKAWEIPRSTYCAQRRRRDDPPGLGKRGRKTLYTDEDLTDRIRHEIGISPFTGEGHRQYRRSPGPCSQRDAGEGPLGCPQAARGPTLGAGSAGGS